jgi:diguanylate cyclase (GGDEF)-like protein
MTDTIDLLAGVPLLGDLDPTELERLAERTRLAHFRTGQTIFRIGAPGDSLYVIVRGEVEVVHPSPSAEVELARLGPGEFFGVTGLLTDTTRNATARAVVDVDVLIVDKDDFRRALSAAPGMSTRLLGALSTRLRDSAERIRTLNEEALRDPLTRLLNRRAFYDRMEGEIGRHQRYGSVFSLLLFDVDNFKNVNDTLGHRAGDEVLTWVGQTLQERTRTADTVFRVGGEEFAVLCPATGAATAHRAAERLIGVVADAHPPRRPEVSVTLSAGWAACPPHGESLRDLYDASDRALLRAKAEGRNRVCDPEPVGDR